MTIKEQGVALEIDTSTIVENPTNVPTATIEREQTLQPSTRLGTRDGWPMRLTYLLGDVAAIAVALVVAKLTVDLLAFGRWQLLGATEFKLYSLLAVALLFVGWRLGSYSTLPPRPARQFRGWLLGSAAMGGSLIGIGWLFTDVSGSVSATLGLATLWAFLHACFHRALCRILFGRANWWGTRLLLIGSYQRTQQLLQEMTREPQWGLRPIGLLVDEIPPADNSGEAARCLGTYQDLGETAANHGVNRAVLAVHSFDDDMADLVTYVDSPIRHWILLPQLDQYPSVWLQACEAARLPAFAVTNGLARPSSFFVKRVFDLIICGLLSLILMPVILLIALLMKCCCRGSVFYGHERVGRGGHRFTTWKFRTMRVDAEEVLASYLASDPVLAEEWEAKQKLTNDPRVTWIGRWLRWSSLDELPQIFNVLKGDMSLVGPRPIVVNEIEKYEDIYPLYLKVPGGITGLWQVSGRSNTTYEERVRLDAYYVQNWSIWLDLYILACTVKVVLLGEGTN